MLALASCSSASRRTIGAYNAELSGFAATGQTVVYVANLRTGTATASFYVDGGLASSMQIFTAPASALGITAGQPFIYSVYAFDNYFSGLMTDSILDQVHSWVSRGSKPTGTIAVGVDSSATVGIQATGSTAPLTQSGVLLLHRSAATNDFSLVQILE